MAIKRAPTHLKHKPVYEIDDYENMDGMYKNNTDVYALSLGQAQWSSDSAFIPSVKVWRKVNNRWSRQSEETTLTRALDMAMLVIKVIDDYKHGIAKADTMEIATTVFGKQTIRQTNTTLKTDLDHFLNDPTNMEDIDAHIDILYDALRAYKNGDHSANIKTS